MAVKWCVDEVFTLQAEALLRQPVSLLAPDLVISEAGNVLLKKLRRGEVLRESIQSGLTIIQSALNLAPTSVLFEQALQIAFDNERSFYDALYVALAQREGCRFVTADERLLNALRPGFGDTLVWLGDVPLA